MTTKLRWGLLGTGGIARKFAAGLRESETGELVAIGSRSIDSAQKFAADFPARVHGTYEALLGDPNVEVVYISTPHPWHAEWSIKAAAAGKHILCEKPLTMNHAEAIAVVEAARTNGVFLMEAFMYRCHPQTARLVELIRADAIGRVQLVQATFSFRTVHELSNRLFNNALGGGGILDVGCYCSSMARLIAGAADGMAFADPVKVKGAGLIGHESRVDEAATALLKFDNGVLAQLAAGVRMKLDSCVRIWGEEGHIEIPSPWIVRSGTEQSKIILQIDGVPREEIIIASDRGLYAIEADTVARFIETKEAPAMTWADSLGNMRSLDRWRAEIGMVYDSER